LPKHFVLYPLGRGNQSLNAFNNLKQTTKSRSAIVNYFLQQKKAPFIRRLDIIVVRKRYRS